MSAAQLAARAAAAAVVPAGTTVAGSQGAFLRAVDEHPDTALLRADALEHARAVAWVLASTASWSTLTTRPTWPVLIERTGLSRASVARWLRWLRQRELLAIVESGTTPRFAPMALAADAGNRAALYVLCVPAAGDVKDVEAATSPESMIPMEENETPTFLVFNLKGNPYPSARANRPDTVADDLTSAGRRRWWRPRWMCSVRSVRTTSTSTTTSSPPPARPEGDTP